MIRLIVGPVRAVAECDTDEDWLWLKDTLTFHNPSARYAKGMPATYCLVDRRGRLPSGLASTIVSAGKRSGHPVSVQGLVPPPVEALLEDEARAQLVRDRAPWLRDYQVEATSRAVRRRRGILWMPTGSGKTEIIIALTLIFPGRWVLLVGSKGLVANAADRYELRTGLPAGRVMEGRHEIVPAFTAATFQGLTNTLSGGWGKDLMESATGLIVDEAHTLPAESFARVTDAAIGATVRIGVSATPLDRTDRKSIIAIGALGPVIHRLRSGELIARGLLSRPVIRVCPCEQSGGGSGARGYARVYRQLVVESDARNRLIVEMALLATKPCLIFVQQLKHLRFLQKMLTHAGLEVATVDGKDCQAAREGRLARMVQGRYDVVIATKVLQLGIDIPELASIVNAGGGKSAIATLQQLGRAMRVTDTKTKCELWEPWDCAARGERNDLAKHASARVATYQDEGYEVLQGPPGGPYTVMHKRRRPKK